MKRVYNYIDRDASLNNAAQSLQRGPKHMLIHDVLERSAGQFASKAALICDDERVTYQDLDDRSNSLAVYVQSMGIQRGDRVAIFMPNGVDAVVSLFGILKANAVFMVIHPGTKPDKVRYMLKDAEAVGIILGRDQTPMLRELCDGIPSLRFVLTNGVTPTTSSEGLLVTEFSKATTANTVSPPQRVAIDLDLAALIYTSGSTGTPKGVMCTHRNMVTATQSIGQYLEATSDDVVLSLLPLSFDYGLYQVFIAFHAGATLVLERGMLFPRLILKRMRTECVTGFPGLPSIFHALLTLADEDYEGLNLRYITNTGDALTPRTIEQLTKRFPSAKVFSMYGLSECKRVSYLPPDQIRNRPTSVGIPIPNTEVFIFNERGEVVGEGETGELVVRGSHVTRGYWGQPEETSRKFRMDIIPGETLLFTGDMFSRDHEGYLYYHGRRDNLLKVRGFRVDPSEIEAVIDQIEGVRQSVVVGKPDSVLGHSLVAVIVPQEGMFLREFDVIAYCKARLEEWLVPSQVVFRKSCPTTLSGKTDRKALGEELL